MERLLIDRLRAWKAAPGRKPLVLRGARQVGKTWLLKEFGRTDFDNVAYVRLEDNEAMVRLFDGSLEPSRILRGIAAQTGESIDPRSTLIVIDEVQAAPRALTALKYFCEDAPEYAVAVAGSLLGVALNAGISFPVGKVTFMDLYPMTFREFLLAMGERRLAQNLDDADFDMLGVFRERYEDLLRVYYYVGGMPEPVRTYAQSGDFRETRKVQSDILESYKGDFAKHAGAIMGERCRMVFDSLPRHLAKENKKFVYGTVKKGARGRDLDDAIQFLADSGLVTKVKRISAPGLPLSAYADDGAFKMYCVDVGLLGAMSGLESETVIGGSDIFTHFKGALTEQYVCQQLVADNCLTPFYWSSEKGTGEVDFVVQLNGKVVPIEVKAEENLKAKSLSTFCRANGISDAVRLSLSGYRRESWMTNIPLYAVHCLDALA